MAKKSLQNQFSKYANEYDNNNIIQQIISKALVRDISTKPQSILELGCGSGQVFKYIHWNYFYYEAIDNSIEMCTLHPKSENLIINNFSFDDDEFFNHISNKYYDIVISSSAMQWSTNIDKLVCNLSKITNNIQVVLFTSNTFKSIYDITHTKSPILDKDTIENIFSKYFKCIFEVLTYKLEFNNKKDMFKYIL